MIINFTAQTSEIDCIEADLKACLEAVVLSSAPLKSALEYAILQGGKRVRPRLAYASSLINLPVKNGFQLPNELTRRVAIAIELIHCYSLVHDDLPCMDDDALRRGKPTCHIEFGESTALLAGDYMQTLAFDVLSTLNTKGWASSAQQVALMRVLSRASCKMVDGQALDLSAENTVISVAELENIHVNKTGALIEASVLMGALSVIDQTNLSDEQFASLNTFSRCLGLAYQVQDDVLDVLSSSEVLGKPAGSDEKLNKSTYPKLLGLEEAKKLVLELHQKALNALVVFGDSAHGLQAIAQQLLDRKF